LCEKSFTGRQVEITRSRGQFKLHCPTEGCNAGPGEWVHPGNPLLCDTAYRDWLRALGFLETNSGPIELSSAA
jgi:hypothetical protein